MKYAIIGGTGTLGNALVRTILDKNPTADVLCFSRDELKQQDMKRVYPTVNYVIGDIRDKLSLRNALHGRDTIFHVAALKHVDVLEKNPTEAIKTNILGTINVAEVAIEHGASHVVFSSTDKAVLPINVYGMTKAVSERYLLNLNGQTKTKFSVFRWANVMGSRGSVIHHFANTLKDRGVVQITDERMTRFWIHIQDAVDFMLSNYHLASESEPMIPPMKASSVLELAAATAEYFGIESYQTEIIGIRPGEKLHECLFSSHDYCVRSDTANKFTKDELKTLIEKAICK